MARNPYASINQTFVHGPLSLKDGGEIAISPVSFITMGAVPRQNRANFKLLKI
jgi:hypothetical protein